MVADEPTGALDSATSAALFELVAQLCHERGPAPDSGYAVRRLNRGNRGLAILSPDGLEHVILVEELVYVVELVLAFVRGEPGRGFTFALLEVVGTTPGRLLLGVQSDIARD